MLAAIPFLAVVLTQQNINMALFQHPQNLKQFRQTTKTLTISRSPSATALKSLSTYVASETRKRSNFSCMVMWHLECWMSGETWIQILNHKAYFLSAEPIAQDSLTWATWTPYNPLRNRRDKNGTRQPYSTIYVLWKSIVSDWILYSGSHTPSYQISPCL